MDEKGPSPPTLSVRGACYHPDVSPTFRAAPRWDALVVSTAGLVGAGALLFSLLAWIEGPSPVCFLCEAHPRLDAARGPVLNAIAAVGPACVVAPFLVAPRLGRAAGRRVALAATWAAVGMLVGLPAGWVLLFLVLP